MSGFISPLNALRRQHGVDHRFLRQQPEGVRQRDAVAEHGADDGFTLDNRFQKLRADKTFPFKLPAQFAEQRLLVDRLVENAEMGRVEVFFQHPRAGAIHQHQLADLL